jgi:hypothetical protein
MSVGFAVSIYYGIIYIRIHVVCKLTGFFVFLGLVAEFLCVSQIIFKTFARRGSL